MIQPGLERIALLLKNVHFPWKAIHVAGTNGKGSICAYASALLTRSNIRCGKFTSPHLIHRWDCISINDSPVSEAQFRKVENHFIQLNEKDKINASEFELLTATAFQLFNDADIDIGVVEVGMGGRLDSTNILNNQAVCIISKIAHDHQSFLGNTLEEIAKHKAGILRPNIPFAVNSMNETNVHEVINKYAREVGASPRLSSDSPEVKGNLLPSNDWQRFAADLQPFQRENAILAYIGVVEALKSLGENTDNVKTLLPGIKSQKILGRFQQPTVFPVFGTGERQITVDGAHNPDAAKALAEFVLRNERTKSRPNKPAPQGGWPVTWVFAMTEGRDPRQYFHHLLRPGDTVITTSFGLVDGMPWVKSMDPEELLNTAVDVEPSIRGVSVPTRGALRALCTAKYFTEQNLPIVLTGSLYLVGEFYREMEEVDRSCSTPEEKVASLAEIDTEERKRVDQSKRHGEKIL